ncbi:uncharacterized protein LOC125374734 [Haliotis rufescens]|uniref:uncharacterized protein LOC125374734 n=1 Tax=Haliotis rufescens TaxID=6454 RepID=UPI00201ED632|nr:uncharacterized protein LOC125374734 [Haliotis rufescens]
MSGRRRSKRKGSTTSRQSSQARGSAQRRRGSQKVAPNNATSDSAVLRDGENGDSSMAEAEVHVVPEAIDEITPVSTTPSGGESVQIGFYPNNTYTPSVNSQMYPPGISNHVPQSQCHNNAPSMVSNPIAPHNSQGIPMFQNVDMLNMPPPTTTQSVDDNLGCNVPVNIKNKIWNGEYINFALLLKPDRDLMDYMTTSAVFISTDGQLELRPKSQGKRIENIFDWTTAFTTYMSIYVQRRMDMVQGLLTHMNTVRLAASRHTGLGWRTYDEQYRLRQARDQSLPWEKLNVELWMLFVQTPYHQQPADVHQPALLPELYKLGRTPVKTQVLERMAKHFPDQAQAQFLVNGFKYGFKLGYDGPVLEKFRQLAPDADLAATLIPDTVWKIVEEK